MAKLAVILPHENLRDTMRMLLRMMRMDQAVILQYSGDYNEIPALVSQAKHRASTSSSPVDWWPSGCASAPTCRWWISGSPPRSWA